LKKILTFVQMVTITLLFTLPGCGGGGDGGNASTSSPQAVVTLSTQSTAALASNTIRGIELYLDLPAGVSVRTDSTGKTASGVIFAAGSATGANTTVLGNYPVTDPASGNGNALKIVLADTDGFNPGDFAVVTCDRASGVSPGPAAFQVNGFKPVEQTGAEITGLSVAYSVLLK
jgi:hypothetical protein